MLRSGELKKLLPPLLFWAGYTALFLLWRWTFFYSLPFLLGLLFAGAVQRPVSFLERKLRLSRGWAAGLVTAGLLGAILVGAILLCVYGVRELTAFLARASQDGFSEFSRPVAEFLQRAGAWLQQFDLTFLAENQEAILEFLKSSMDLVTGFLGAVLGAASSLPTAAVMVLVTGVAAFFFTRDYEKLKAGAKGRFSGETLEKLRRVREKTGGRGRKYLLSYLFLYFLTFCETAVILGILGLPYPLVAALLTAVADVLPILGPGFVFLPLTVYQLLIGSYGAALGLLLGWGLVSLIRQVTEPKLIASTGKIHPLAMLMAVYFSLVGKSLWLLVYTAGFFMVWSPVREAGVLDSASKSGNTPAE